MSGRRFSIAQTPKDPTEEAFVATWELTLELHAAGGYAPLDTEKATKAVYGVMCEGMTWIARAPDGTPVGTLALTELPFWYSKTPYLQDAWFYVRPQWRKKGVGTALLRAARAAAEKRGLIAMITVTNPDRRPKKTKATLDSQIAGYVPLGYTIRLTR